MGVDENGHASVVAAYYFHNFRVSKLGEATAAVFLGRRHAEDAVPSEAGDDFGRYLRIAVDGGGVDMLVGVAANLGHGPGRLFVLVTAQRGIGEQQRRVETAKEQTFGEAERLWSGEKEFFGLFTLLVDLRGSESHDYGLDKRDREIPKPHRRWRQCFILPAPLASRIGGLDGYDTDVYLDEGKL